MAADPPLSGTLLGWMVRGEWRAHPVRTLVAVLAIAVGVALGFAVHLVNRSALVEFDAAVRSVSGAADLRIEAVSAAGFDESLFPIVARLPGLAAVSPVVEVPARTADGRSLTVIGVDPLRAARVTPALAAGSGAGFAAGGPLAAEDAVWLSPALRPTADGAFTVLAGGERIILPVAGGLPSVEAGRRIAVADIAAVQQRFNRLGRLTRLDIALAPGARPEAVARDITARLPADARLSTPEAESRRTADLSRAYRVNLGMLAMVALLTGGFLVFSAQSLSIARRRAAFALLRVLGLPRTGLFLQVLAEGAVLGLVGAAIGLLAGAGLAWSVLGLLGGDLGGGYFSGSRPTLDISPGWAAIHAGLGLVVALAGSLFPALEAARAAPALALKSAGQSGDPRRRPALLPALALGLVGLAFAFAPPVAGLPLFGYLSIALILAAGVAAMPWLARLLIAPLARMEAPVPVRLAAARLAGAPDQAAVALCGLVASAGLMAAMGLMVASFRGSVDDWLGAILPADIYLRVAEAETSGLDTGLQARLAALPGVGGLEARRSLTLRLAADRPAGVLLAVPGPGGAAAPDLPWRRGPVPAAPGETPVWVSEPLSRLYDLAPGDTLDLPLAGGRTPVRVAGVWRDYGRQFGALAMDRRDYVRLTGDAGANEAGLTLAPGARLPEVLQGVRAALPPDLAAQTEAAPAGEIRRAALRIFDRSFAVTYALEAVAILVGVAGVAATVSAQTLARRREFGMLRHVGASRGQILAMLALEGAFLGAVGAVAGLALGAAMGQVLIQVVNPQSFNWTMDTRWPLGLLGGLALALTLASSLTALLAGRSALSADAVRAVREDW
ncbi:FtsX-like permease family protein [Phenylobacterium sp.]|uniref:FtsX-like permease family protein n=1 Tax=Phenylobacterium sp. TaxID=1871053 RepID=UPI0025EBC9B2|nr:ABC transporter permease [Phenylobacterium sp.]MCA6327344.1 ABC transporter permease [Phenylobacterium sp.]